MLSMISNIQLEDDDYDYNLSFADEKTAARNSWEASLY